MDHQTLQRSLAVISEGYGEDVANYVHRVVKAESKSVNLEAEEILSISYIVLERTLQKYDASRGNFKNYAIRSLKNELIRSKAKDFLLLESFDADDKQSPISKVAVEDAAFATEFLGDTLSEHKIALKNREIMYLALSASLLSTLTAFEKSLIYYIYYATDISKNAVLRAFSRQTGVSHYALSTTLDSAMSKIQAEVSSI